MSVDTIANMLSMLKNASLVGKKAIELPYSKQKEAIAKVLESRGFVAKVKVFKDKNLPYKSLHIDLAYSEDGTPAIRDLRRVSKPGRRMYRSAKALRSVKGGLGVAVVSTSRGIMSGLDAKKKRLGGEIICEVW